MESTLFGFIWKHSKRDQITLLFLTATLFPLLYLTLELPKRIINDAIGAPDATVVVLGYDLPREYFLWLLCGLFLLAVLVHGLLKMRINTRKGVLAERLLRRFRYMLIVRILRFPAPYLERVSEGELVSMITAESEPMGGLMGDAVSQPVLQAGQMLTILGFLFVQSVWFGLAACALIPLQAWLIPRLQRRINRLNKQRIGQVRQLAGEIGETATGAAALRVHGGWRHRLARISDRLGHLYEIRFDIYRKKFFMKFLNNFITQLTPFFFFSVGGYLVLRGAVSLGALVAALAAYKDLSSPWKELLTWYNQTQEMRMRWQVITDRFAPAGLAGADRFAETGGTPQRLDGDIELRGVTVRDLDGNTVLDGLDVAVTSGTTVAVASDEEEDRLALAALLTREVPPAVGQLLIGGQDLAEVPQSVIAARIGYAGPRPLLFGGTFRDNLLMPLRRYPTDAEPGNPVRAAEARRAGNSADDTAADWTDPTLAGFDTLAELDGWALRLIDGIGAGGALFERGLDMRPEAAAHPDLAARLVDLRGDMQQAVADAKLDRQVLFFRDDLYNLALPVSENLLFAVPRHRLSPEMLAGQTGFLARLRETGLDRDLIALACDLIDVLHRTFGHDGTDHPLFRRLGLDPETYQAALALVARVRAGDDKQLTPEEIAVLLFLPFRYSAQQIGPAFPEEIMARVLEIRKSHARVMQHELSALFDPLDFGTYAPGLTVMENLLFGRVRDVATGSADDVRALVGRVLGEHGLRDAVAGLALDMEVRRGGAGLPTALAEPLAVARAAIRRPDILVLNRVLAGREGADRDAALKRLRALLPGTTFIRLDETIANPDDYDAFFELHRGRLQGGAAAPGTPPDSAAGADLAQKVRALERCDLFATLGRRQLRLLAFGARWFDAPAGEVVFRKGDAPRDGAYLLIEGEAGIYRPTTDDARGERVSMVGPGSLVGELSLIRGEKRALSLIAETDLHCLRLGADEFLAVAGSDAGTAFRLLQVVAGYLSD